MEERANLPPPGSAPLDEASGATLSQVLGQQFGTEGLEAASPAVSASAAAVAEVVLKQVLSHSGGHLDDDAAVLVLRRNPVV